MMWNPLTQQNSLWNSLFMYVWMYNKESVDSLPTANHINKFPKEKNKTTCLIFIPFNI